MIKTAVKHLKYAANAVVVFILLCIIALFYWRRMLRMAAAAPQEYAASLGQDALYPCCETDDDETWEIPAAAAEAARP